MRMQVLLATLLLLGVAGQGQQSPLVSQMRVPQQTNRASTKHAKVVSHEPRAFARVAASSPNAEVQLESMIQVAQAENQANLVGPFSRYGADLMQFAPHQQTGMLPGVFGNPTNAFQVRFMYIYIYFSYTHWANVFVKFSLDQKHRQLVR